MRSRTSVQASAGRSKQKRLLGGSLGRRVGVQKPGAAAEWSRNRAGVRDGDEQRLGDRHI